MYGDVAFLAYDHLFHFHAIHPDLANNNQANLSTPIAGVPSLFTYPIR